MLALIGADKVYFNPHPEFRMYPGDRIVLLGTPEQTELAGKHLRQREFGRPQEQIKAFDSDEVFVPADSPWSSRSLAELDFPNRFGVTVIGIRRGKEQITSPSAEDVLRPQDSIIVVGNPEGVAKMKTSQESCPVNLAEQSELKIHG